MQTARNLKEYSKEVAQALNDEVQRATLNKFAVQYPVARANAFKGYDVADLIKQVADSKDYGIAHMDELFEEFKKNAEKLGIKVHVAKDSKECNKIISQIAKENNVKSIIKSKSMTAEETLLNHDLEHDGYEVVESDLGEYIIQLRHEGPSHMVMPAIHLSRFQVRDLFADVTKQTQTEDIQRLVKVARRELRVKYVEADMGISGVNFALANSGTIGLATNEGNARLVTTLPKVHVAILGFEKLVPSFKEALKSLRVLTKNATGQANTSYNTWITGPNEMTDPKNPKKIMHIVFLDNGRRKLSKNKEYSQILRCVRCGACAQACPVYRMIGGHKYGHIYIGAIGMLMTYFFHGADKAKNLVQNCINCGSCGSICAAGIELPRLIKQIYAEMLKKDGKPLYSSLAGALLKNRKLFHTMLRFGQFAQKPVVDGQQFLRHLPMMFMKDQQFRALPGLAPKAFRDMWSDLKPKVDKPVMTVALFGGCVEDFVYPQHLKAALKVMEGHNIAVEYPMEQNCCGLPTMMLGETEVTADIAKQNMDAFDSDKYDYIVTLCASCGSHLKHNYEHFLKNDPKYSKKLKAFTDKVMLFTQFVQDVLKIDAGKFNKTGEGVTYHSPCHAVRGMDVFEQPHELIKKAGFEFKASEEENVCCGFGGTYMAKFPKISEQILNKKLENAGNSGAKYFATECPGCYMQLSGAVKKKGMDMKVMHIAELMASTKK